MKVIVVGAGPSGLLLGLLLAKAGIEVTVLEASSKLNDQPRASHYAPSANVVLDSAGLFEEVVEAGFIPDGVCWREPDGTILAGIRQGNAVSLDPRHVMTCLPLDRLIPIISRGLEQQSTATTLLHHRVTHVEQDENGAMVHVETPNGATQMTADYIVGCDGANSIVRRKLFGDWGFPGRSWEQQIIATNVYYPFEKFEYWDSNFILHPTDWFMAAKITKDGLWRVTYGDVPNLTDEEYRQRQPLRYEQILPGNPKPHDYKIENIGPYKMHQRLAPKMRVGRILLAADAAHLCNPFGGLGLTSGIADVEGLSQCLVGIYRHQAETTILDKYDEIRRERYQNYTDPISSVNYRRMFTEDTETVTERQEFFEMLKRAGSEKELAKKMQLASMDLRHDFTQYFKQSTSGEAAF